MKKYAIVLNNAKKKHLILSSWLDENKEFCHYPINYSDSQVKEAIINDERPNDDWELDGVDKVVKFYDDYVTAIQDLNVPGIEDATDPSDTEKMKKSRNKRHKKILSSDCVNFPSKRSKIQVDKSNELENFSDIEANNTQSPKDPSPLPSASTNHTEKSHDRSGYSILNNVPSHLNIRNSSQTDHQSETDKAGLSEHSLNDDSDDDEVIGRMGDRKLLKKIYDVQKTLLNKVNTVMIRQKNLEKKIIKFMDSKNKPAGQENSVQIENLKMLTEYFPINADGDKHNQKVERVEIKLLEKKFLKAAVQYLRGAGGQNAHDLILNMMPKVVNDEVLPTYSFTGRKTSKDGEKNKSFSELTLCSCIYQATKLTFPSATDAEIKATLSNYLDQAKTRFTRSKKTSNKRAPFKPIQIDDLEDDDIAD